MNNVTFIIASNDSDILKANILRSPLFSHGTRPELIIKRNYESASMAYNDGINSAKNDLIILVHQDVYLPKGWEIRLSSILFQLQRSEVKWGVLGVYGVNIEGLKIGCVYSNGLKKNLKGRREIGEVQSLDELLLIIRKSNNIYFDDAFPHFHLYGTDICMNAQKLGFKTLAISNFCMHNSLPIRRLNKEYWECVKYLRRKWKNDLPINTCVETLHKSRLKMLYNRLKSEMHYLINRNSKTYIKRLTPEQLLNFSDDT